jgi:hypothetical protein
MPSNAGYSNALDCLHLAWSVFIACDAPDRFELYRKRLTCISGSFSGLILR